MMSKDKGETPKFGHDPRMKKAWADLLDVAEACAADHGVKLVFGVVALGDNAETGYFGFKGCGCKACVTMISNDLLGELQNTMKVFAKQAPLGSAARMH